MTSKKETPRKPRTRLWSLILVAVLLVSWFGVSKILAPNIEEVPLSEIVTQIAEGDVKSASIFDSSRTVEVTLEDGSVLRSGYPVFFGTELFDQLTEAGIETEATPVQSSNLLETLLISIFPIVLIIGFLIYFMRGKAGGLNIGKLSKKRGAPVDVPETRFSDVAGADEVVSELREVTEFLQEPERFLAHGARVPRGFLLSGPPGTGKTLLARAVAGEAGVPFFALSGSDFVETFVGVGAGRMREIFEKAKEVERAIIFIDEIDAVGKARSSGVQTGANEERENTLNALLTEMDGFAQTSGIIVLAATNRPDILDPALTRPGRFDRKIVVPAPDRKGREQIFALHSKGLTLDESVDFASLGRRTPGLTGADISGLVNEAALESARSGSKAVTARHFESALQTTVLGRERRSAIISERDQEITAWHEAGHTVAAMLLEHAHDPVTVTIVPRGPAGGVTWMGGSDHDFMTRSQAHAQLVVAMAGRAAEEVILKGDFTQGAQGDLSSATGLASEMISRYGMGEKLVFLKEGQYGSEDIHLLNSEISNMLERALLEARKLLEDERELLEAVALRLLEVETLSIDELREIEAKISGVQPLP